MGLGAFESLIGCLVPVPSVYEIYQLLEFKMIVLQSITCA
jgi:hypothetical protein